MPKTGFCSVGHHEGGRYPGPSGKLNKTCMAIDSCTCDNPTCHKFFDKMFADAGMPRQAVDNSGYEPGVPAAILSGPTVVMAAPILSSTPVDLAPDTLESVAPGIVPPVKRGSYVPTKSGRAARGQLEAQVNHICTIWVVEDDPTPCTPQFVSFEIGKLEGIKNPSTGAIAAVFDRWEKIGYAEIGRKPTQFKWFTDEAIEKGLDWMKKKAPRL